MRFGGGLDQFDHVDAFVGDFELAVFDAGEFEHVVGERPEALRVRANGMRGFGRLRSFEVTFLEQFGEPDDRGQRPLDVVREHGDQIVLELVELQHAGALTFEFFDAGRKPVGEFLPLDGVAQLAAQRDVGEMAFEQVVLRARGDGGGCDAFVSVAADDHDGQRRRRILQTMQRFDTVNVRQAQIEQRGIESLAADRGDGLVDARGNDHLELVGIEHGADHRRIRRIVFDDQYAQRLHATSPSTIRVNAIRSTGF